MLTTLSGRIIFFRLEQSLKVSVFMEVRLPGSLISISCEHLPNRLRVSLSHTEGSADVIVGMEGKTPIYRGNGQQNADFVLEIAETGSYHIFVSGHQAKGNVSFTRISGEKE